MPNPVRNTVRINTLHFTCSECTRPMDVLNCEVGVRHQLACMNVACSKRGIAFYEPEIEVQLVPEDEVIK